MSLKKVVFIVGPTGTGKTEISTVLAKKICGEIVCCDSMQIYKGLDILTAQPSKNQTSLVRHHLFGIRKPTEDFSVARYRKLALKKIKEIHNRSATPVFVGGTGLYAQALLDGLFVSPLRNLALRRGLQARAARYGPGRLHEELKKIDASAAAAIHPNDTRRIIRAIEVYRLTGRPISQLQAESAGGIFRKYAVYVFCFFYKDRSKLYERINRRVLDMFEAGVVDEVKGLPIAKLSMTASQALGLSQIKGLIRGECGLERARYLLMRDTRRYAKRQLSWFRRDKRIKWIALDRCKGPTAAVQAIFKTAPELKIP